MECVKIIIDPSIPFKIIPTFNSIKISITDNEITIKYVKFLIIVYHGKIKVHT